MLQIYLAILGLFALFSLKPNFVKTVGIKIIYNTIYVYSACQIKCTQAYNYLLPYFKNNEIMDQIKIEQFDFDTNKVTNILEKDLQHIVKNNLYIASANDNSNINKNNSSVKNKLIIDKNIICLAFDISNITFIALYLNCNGIRYNINLKTDEFNYYLVGNKIDRRFVQYYINAVLDLKFSYTDPEITTYELELIDHEVNIIYLSYNQSIMIDKDGYHIIENIDETIVENKVDVDVDVEVEVEDINKLILEEKVN